MAASWTSVALLPLVLSATAVAAAATTYPWPPDTSSRSPSLATATAFKGHGVGPRRGGEARDGGFTRPGTRKTSHKNAGWRTTKRTPHHGYHDSGSHETIKKHSSRSRLSSSLSSVTGLSAAGPSTTTGFMVPSVRGATTIPAATASCCRSTTTTIATKPPQRSGFVIGATSIRKATSSSPGEGRATGMMFSSGVRLTRDDDWTKRYSGGVFASSGGDGSEGRQYGRRQEGAWRPWGRQGRVWGDGGARRRLGGRSLVVVGLGSGETEYYSWAETDADVELRVRFPPGTAAKNIELALSKTNLMLGLKGREGAILQGKLLGEVQPELSNWTMEEIETGEKVLYLCLQKVISPESGLGADWLGVLEGETPTKTDYPENDKEFDVQEYVKKMGYDPERDSAKVDKTMFSDLTESMKADLSDRVPKSSYTDTDEMTPAVAKPKVSPVIDNGVLGMKTTNTPPSDQEDASSPIAPTVMDAEMAEVNHDQDKKTTETSSEAKTGKANKKQKPRGTKEEAERIYRESASMKELTPRQREIAVGLRQTYEKMMKNGMIKEEYDETGAPLPDPDMDELAKQYDLGMGDVVFKEGGFTQEEVRKYSSSVLTDDDDTGNVDELDFELDVNDPAVREAFGLD